MSSEKFETVNQFVSIARALHKMIVALPESLEGGTTLDEVMRKDMAIRLELVHAAQAVKLAPHDPEADRIIGGVLLGRIEAAAAAAQPIKEWEACAAEAIHACQENAAANEKITAWLDLSQPIVDLGLEAMQRGQEQQHEIMVEGLRRAAEQTPGLNLRITETFGDTLISDETVLGPEPGHEDSEGHRVGRVSSSVKGILGIDDDRMETDVSHLIQSQAPLVPARNNLPPNAQEDQVRLAVCRRVISKIDQDLDIVGVTGDLPAPITDLEASHFPALRAQLMLQHNIPLSEGAVLSRATRGDRSAQGLLMQLVVLSDMLSWAEPYFLPVDQMTTPVRDEDLQLLPPGRSFLVWHDRALHVGEGVDILAWLFATDEQSNIHPVAHVIRAIPGGALETSWCSLRQGQAAAAARQISRLLRGGDWETARPLRLPKPNGSKAWKKALVRSSARLKAGGLHGLRTLPL